MKKNFLLLLLMTLLPLATWAQTAPTVVGSPITWDGNQHALIATPAGLPTGYQSSYGLTSSITPYFTTNGGTRRHYDDPAGIQYYVRGAGDPAPQNGEDYFIMGGTRYYFLNWSYTYGSYGITYEESEVSATDVGTYTVYWRMMRDHAGTSGDYQTTNWQTAGTVTIQKPSLSDMPYYVSGPQRVSGLVYNDEDQELITAGTEFCHDYDQANGGVQYVVKTTHAKPTPEEEMAATSTIPTGKDAGTYYVYYKISKDGGYYTYDSGWSEVGVGGIKIAKRNITEADFTVTFADGLVYDESDQDLVTDFDWTNTITRGTVEYIVNDEEPSTGTPTATPTGKDAGDYNLRLVITGDANHYDFISDLDYGQVKIAKAKYKVTEPTIGTFTYNGDPQGPLASATSEVVLTGADGTKYYGSSHRIEYRAFTTTENWVVDPDNAFLKRTNAGTYTIKYRTRESTTANANYEPVEGELEFTIDKADWTVKEPGLTPDWEYDAKEYALLDAEVAATGAKTDVGVVKYYINDGEAIEFDAVKAKDAGEYEVWYEVEGTKNYNAVAKKSLGTVKVDKHGVDVAAQSLTITWTGTPVDAGQLIVVDPTDIPADETAEVIEGLGQALAGFKAGEFKLIKEDLTEEAVEPIPSDAGNYKYVLETKEHQNYKINAFGPNGTLTIMKDNSTAATVTAADLTYDGTEQALLNVDDATLKGGVMLYYLGEAAPLVGSSDWKTEVPTAKPAKDAYKVWYMLKGDKNHNDIAAADIDVVIKQKALADGMFALASDEAEFNGENLMPEFTFADSDPSILAETDFTVTKVDGDGNDVTEMKNVGEYTFTFKATDEGNYQGTITKTFKITPKPIDAEDVVFALETESVPYDGDDHKADVKVVPVAPLTEADYEVVLPTEMVMAGKYEIKLNGKGNYTSSATATFTITQAENAVTVEIEDWTYGEPANDPVTTATFAAAGEPTITYATAEEPEVFGTYSEIINDQAGSYIVKASVAETPEWAAAEATDEFEIAKAKSEITTPTFAKNLTYNGLEQALLSAGAKVPEDGKVTYAVNGGEESEDIPVAKNVGKYVITTTYTPDDNHLPATIEDITVEIHPVVLTFALANVEKTWDGEKLTAEQVDKLQGSMYGELQAEDEYEPPFTLSLPEELKDVTDAGTYNFTQMVITWEEEGVENYNIKFSGTGLIQINKADLVEGTDYTAPVKVDGLVYNGDGQQLVTPGEMINEYGTMLYSVAKDGEYGETPSGYTEAGEYEIWWYVKGDKNHNDTEPVKIENSIAAKAMDFVLKFEDTEVEFDGQNQMPADVVAYDGEKGLMSGWDYNLTINGEDANDELPEIKNVGTYEFVYTGINNYAGSTATATITVKAKALEDKMIALKNTSVDYNAKNQKPEYTLTYNDMTLVEGTDFTVEADEEMINAGKYTFTFTGQGNYEGTAKADFTIGTLPVIVTAPDVTKAYNGKAGLEGAEVGEFVYNGVLANDKIELAGDVADYLTVVDAKAEVGTYTIKVNEEAFNGASVNYQITATIDGKLTITQAKDEVTINVAKDFKFTKVYGDAAVVSVPELVVEGAAEEDVAAIKAGVELKKNDYDENVGTQKDAYSLVAKKDAKVFGNYENVVFGNVDMEITKAPLIVSIKAQDKAYDGKPAEIEITKDYIKDMIAVEGLKFDDTAAILVGKVTATIGDGNAVNVGEYNIALEGELENYDITPILGTYNIVKAVVTATLADQKVQQGKAIDKTFTDAAGIAEGEEEFFYVDAPGLVDAEGKVTGDAGYYEEGLVLAVDAEHAANYTIEAVPAALEIISAETIILADDAAFVTEEKKGVDVTFSDRNINAGTWNVVALPFATTVKQVSDAFGYAAVDLMNEDGTTPGEVHFKVISSGEIPAYTPFIIKTTEDKDLAVHNFNEVTFYGVDIEAWDGKNNAVEDKAENKFWGTFQEVTVLPAGSKDYWYMSKGAWYSTSGRTKDVNLKPFRAYIQFPEGTGASARIFVEEPDGTETAIKGINAEGQLVEAEGWYTVNGMKLDAAPTQKGTYINNGKKVIVK